MMNVTLEVERLKLGEPYPKASWDKGSGRQRVELLVYADRIDCHDILQHALWHTHRFELTTTVSTVAVENRDWRIVGIETGTQGLRMWVPPAQAGGGPNTTTSCWFSVALQKILDQWKAQHIQLAQSLATQGSARHISQHIQMAQEQGLHWVGTRSSAELRQAEKGSMWNYVAHKHKLLSLCAVYQRRDAGPWDQPIRWVLLVLDLGWTLTLTLLFRYLSDHHIYPLEKWQQSILAIGSSLGCMWLIEESLGFAVRRAWACCQWLIFLVVLLSSVTALVALDWLWWPRTEWVSLTLPLFINWIVGWLIEILLWMVMYRLCQGCCPCCDLDDRATAQVDALANDQATKRLNEEREGRELKVQRGHQVRTAFRDRAEETATRGEATRDQKRNCLCM